MTGEYQHVLDNKGRLFMPARLRDDLGEVFYLCKGLDGCLFVYSSESWGKLEEKIAVLPISQARQIQRTIYPSAQKCEPDSQGRVLINQKLRDYAGLDKNVTVIGAGGHAEIWASAAWENQDAQLTAQTLEDAMNLLNL